MHAIAYVSSAAWNLLDEDLELIVRESRRFNTASGVTGVLLYCEGNFMQYLEGPAEMVAKTYARIKASERHYQINELMNQGILEREFSDWTMGFSQPQPAEFLELAAARWKGSVQTGPGAELLRLFRSNGRLQIA